MSKFNFGENLRIIRSAKGISQDAMAAALNISQTTYSKIERQAEIPEIPAPIKIATALAVPLIMLVPPVEDVEIAAVVPVNSTDLQLNPKPFLRTTLGMLITLAASAALIDVVYQAIHGVCDALGTSAHNTILIKWTGALTTMFCLIFIIRRARR